MKIINNCELKNIYGGAGFSGAMVSALKGYFNVILGVGQTLGSGIRRIFTNNMCGC